MTEHTRRVVVIGAGLAGLTAAATAARAGARVTLLEARAHEGGRARTRAVDGFLLNQGAHALYRGGPAWEILAEFGIAPAGRSPDATRGWGVRADGRFGVLPGSLTSLVRSPLLAPRAKLELASVLARPERLPASVPPGASMQQWIDGRMHHPDARALVALLSRVATYCGDLDRLDAAAGVAQVVQAMTHGVVYLDRGWQQLVDALRTTAAGAGVTISTGAKVDAVESRDAGSVPERHAGSVPERSAGVTVRTHAGDVEADAVVLALGGPADAAAMLHGASEAVARWARDQQPVYASALDVALRALPVPSRRITFGVDEPTYLSVHTPYAQLAPHGGEVVHLLRYGDPDDTGHDPRGRLEALFDRAQPGWREQVVAERYGRRLVVAHGRPLPGRGLAGRPATAVPDLPGVCVAGDWVGPHGLLTDAVLASGRAAGRAAAGSAAAATTGAEVVSRT
jgi:phytoene dehydrogenase-like protein